MCKCVAWEKHVGCYGLLHQSGSDCLTIHFSYSYDESCVCVLYSLVYLFCLEVLL